MHDLHTINRLNAKAFAAGINIARLEGKTVVTKRFGLHVEGFERFDNVDQAAAYVRNNASQVGVTMTILPPLSEAEAASLRGRDQSEDRLVNRSSAPAAEVVRDRLVG